MSFRNIVLVLAVTATLVGFEKTVQSAAPKTTAKHFRTVRVAMPHDLDPRNELMCVGAHDERGYLYDLGCNVGGEKEPMVGIHKATFNEAPDAAPAAISNPLGSAWRCRFSQIDVVLVCERLKRP
jgi:hypothetical protein